MISFKSFLNENSEPDFIKDVTKIFDDMVNVKKNNITVSDARDKSRKNNCVFCDHTKIQASNIERHKLRGFNFLSFTPLDPITPGHLLVIPEIHVDDASTAATITGITFELASTIADEMGYKHYNLIVNKGEDADQTVFHLHVHIVPRYPDDKTITIWNKDNSKT